MNKLKLFLLGLAFFGAMQSCKTPDYIMTDAEIAEKKYTTHQHLIMKNKCVVARVTNVEWEIYKGNMVQEISVTIDPNADPNITKDLLRYCQTRYPDAKIEVNTDTLNY